ncbi:MAG: hypothetical protein HY865_03180 [Chloroflexi bacterium]|nr:hypothetical protein [Chloroflexota bacterium]
MMKVNIGDLMGSAYRIGWRHKMLWLWQVLPGLAVIFVFPSVFIVYPFFTKLIQDPELQIPIEPWMSISLNSMGILFVLSYALMWIFAQITTIHGAIEIEKGATKLSFRELFRKSLPYVWRVIGLYFLYCGMWALISIGSRPILAPVAKNFPSISEPLLYLLALPISIIWLVSMVVLELAQAAIVSDNMTVIAAVSRAWEIFKGNVLDAATIMIVLYFGMIIPFSLLLMPLPFLISISLLFLTRASDANVIFFTVFFAVIPLAIILTTLVVGIFMTFFQSGWAVAYIRLNRNADIPTALEEKPQETGI